MKISLKPLLTGATPCASSSPAGGRGVVSALCADHKAHRTAAFTMVEIALSLAVIAFALVAIIGVLPIGMNVQKDNREETVINFDANYLMNAIRNGALGQDSLTNYIISITHNYTLYDDQTNVVPNGTGVNWYYSSTNSPSPPNYYSAYGVFGTSNFLSSGANIIGLLTTPKYIANSTPNWFVSNYITADFRAITGSPLDQGASQNSYDFAFGYRLYPEITPFSITNAAMMAPNLAHQLQNNLADIRLKFRWPLLPGKQLGNGSQVYRTSASGQIKAVPSTTIPLVNLYYYQPQGYAANPSTNNILP